MAFVPPLPDGLALAPICLGAATFEGDEALTRTVLERLDVKRLRTPLVSEGCSFRLDGFRTPLREVDSAIALVPAWRFCAGSPHAQSDLVVIAPVPPMAQRKVSRVKTLYLYRSRSSGMIMTMLLGDDAPEAGARVVVAMSGGVDSALTAALCYEAGYEVVGVTLHLHDHGRAAGKPGSCCAGQDLRDARTVAARLGFAHYVLDYEERFRCQVIEDFGASYARGETPIPCVRCNQKIKFADLLESARELGAAALMTGHYALRVVGPKGAELHRARDLERDQSYFLFTTTRDQLDFLRFPLGGLSKTEVRLMAAERGLIVADKPDSQDICFVPEGRYTKVIDALRPGAGEPGEIVDLSGRVLGSHRGIVHYTVGQRRGLGLDHKAGPLYVVRLDAKRRQVVVGPAAALAQNRVILRETNWLADIALGRDLHVKLRSRQLPAPARLESLEAGAAELRLLSQQGAVAPGQAAVVYEGARLLGGGFIASSDWVDVERAG